MQETAPITNSVVVTPRAGAPARLRTLLSLMAEAGVALEVVETAEEAAARLLVADASSPQCVLIDASAAVDGSASAVADVVRKIEGVRHGVPHIAPVIVASSPPPALIIAAFRAGAGDFVDLSDETEVGLRSVLQRAASDYQAKVTQRKRVRELRRTVEEFLRDLVLTERRSIDLEHQLAQHSRQAGFRDHSSELDAERPPTVFVIEDDREVADRLVDELEDSGVTTFAFVTGEDAVLEAQRMHTRGEPIDLLMVDARLPGMDGLEAIRQVRHAKPGVAAMLMTGYSDTHTAANAADLGVVGYVLKPFDDIPALIARVRTLAARSMSSARDLHYLHRIKERHERVLLRYRKLAADLERLS